MVHQYQEYRDKTKIKRILTCLFALVLINCVFFGSMSYADNADKTASALGRWKNIVQIEMGPDFELGLCADGTVLRHGGEKYGLSKVDRWNNIRQLAVVAFPRDEYLALGLKADGTVVSTQSGSYSSWKNVKKLVCCGYEWIAGLKADGTAVITKKGELSSFSDWNRESGWLDLSRWDKLIDLFPVYGWSSTNGIAGLRSDGRVMVQHPDGVCFERWDYIENESDIVDICPVLDMIFGLHGDGTLAVPPSIEGTYKEVGNRDLPSHWINIRSLYTAFQADLFAVTSTGQVKAVVCSPVETEMRDAITEWKNIKTLYPLYNAMIGLKSDGTLVWKGDRALSALSGWRNITELYFAQKGGALRVVGLKSDGTLCYVEMDIN